jgi:6,7-dimethyl-8-ribityllumazine synthase
VPPSSQGGKESPGVPDGLSSGGLRLAIVASRFNGAIVDRLVEGALEAFRATGTPPEKVTLVRVPGAFELPLAAARLAGAHDAVVGLGCVIRGETAHYEHVARVAADGLARVQLDSGVPVGFGVLTTDTVEQAQARAGGQEGNLGFSAAMAVVEMAQLPGNR